MQIKMCVLGAVILLLLCFFVCFFSLNAYGRSTEYIPYISLDETKVTNSQVSLSINLHKPPSAGFYGLLFWIEVKNGHLQNVLSADIHPSVHLEHQITQTPDSTIVGILFDTPTPFVTNHPLTICQIDISFNFTDTPIYISIIYGEICHIDEQGNIVTNKINHTSSIISPLVTEEITSASTEHSPTIQTQPTIHPTQGIFIGFQDNSEYVEKTGPYALRFLFSIDKTSIQKDIPLSVVICLQGKDILFLTCNIKNTIFCMENQKQIEISPPHEGDMWLTYTYHGISPQTSYTFCVYDSQGSHIIHIEQRE